jgi:hypothetical protein
MTTALFPVDVLFPTQAVTLPLFPLTPEGTAMDSNPIPVREFSVCFTNPLSDTPDRRLWLAGYRFATAEQAEAQFRANFPHCQVVRAQPFSCG